MNKIKAGLIKLQRSPLFTKFYQFWYLTISNFNNNNLWDSACSCSFGFVFSFVPIVLIIFTILISVLKVSPVVLQYIYTFNEQIKDIVDLTPLINNLVNLKSIRFVDIFLAFWVIWMARKLFLSIVRGMNYIFHSHQKRKGLFIQLFTFLSEFVVIFIFVTVIMSTFTFNKIFTNSMRDNSMFSFFHQQFPTLFQTRSNIIFTAVTYFLLFLFNLYCYKVVSGSNPRFRICVFYAFCGTVAFFVFSSCINLFMNIPNYNFIYGTISTLIILMMKVYFFFVIFLFCAQMIYVSQFFDTLVLAELYLLPDSEKRAIADRLRRKTFTNSTALQTKRNTVHIKAGEVIYTKGDDVNSVFYLRKGEVWEETDKESLKYQEGSFFGEVPLIINQGRLGTATALTDCEIMQITSERFLELMKANPRVSVQALKRLKQYTSTENTFSQTE